MGWPCCARSKISIHALREEGDATVFASSAVKTYFNPRPPRGGRPGYKKAVNDLKTISIHALREEGDKLPSCITGLSTIFQSTPSARRATTTFPAAMC